MAETVEYSTASIKDHDKLLDELSQVSECAISQLSFEVSLMAESSGKSRDFFLDMPLPELNKHRIAFSEYVFNYLGQMLLDKGKEILIHKDLVPHSPNQRNQWNLK